MQKKFSGQIGLILLVVMSLVIAIALSLASRSLSDTVLSRQESESSKAFRVAETGVEQALNQIRTSGIPNGPLTQSEGIFSGSTGVAGQTSYALYVKEGEQASLDLTGFVDSNNLTISWTRKSDVGENKACVGEGSGNAPAAIEVLASNAATNTVSFAYYNGNGCFLSNNFTTSGSGGNEYLSQISYDVAPGTTSLRIRPIYADATIEVAGNTLGTQLYLIQAAAEGGDAKKEIEVKRGLDAPPSVFDFALFSGGSIVK